MTETAYDRVLAALRSHGHKVVESGSGRKAQAQCAGHNGDGLKLTITGIEGSVLLCCHSRKCPTDQIVAGMGLTMADLYDGRSATYRYDDGRTVKRYYAGDEKQFAQRNATETSTLYHLTQLQQVPTGRTVFLVEGEKDVHAIEAAGGVATTAPQGADSFHKVDVSPLAGHRIVVVVDRPNKPGDHSGHDWAAQVYSKLNGVVEEKPTFVYAKEGKDAADHIAAEHGLNDWEPYEPPDDAAVIEPELEQSERDRRIARIRALTYRRSELSLIPPPSWLIQGVTTRASLTLLSGKFGTYKSFVSIAMACSVATGKPFLGHHVEETGPVIIIAAEGASGVRARIEAWEYAHNGGREIPDDMLIVVGGAVNILRDDDMAGIEELCKAAGPRKVIWDTLHRCAPGIDENSNSEMGAVIDRLSDLRENYNCTQVVNHHTGHAGQRSRGASALEDDFDNSWVIKLAGDGEDRSAGNQRTLEHRKVKDGELSENIPIGLVSAGLSAYVDQMLVSPDKDGAKGWLVMKAYAQQLDIAGIPLEYGRERIRGALKDLGTEVKDNTVLSELAKMRKAPDYAPYRKPSADGLQTLSDESV